MEDDGTRFFAKKFEGEEEKEGGVGFGEDHCMAGCWFLERIGENFRGRNDSGESFRFGGEGELDILFEVVTICLLGNREKKN